MSGSAEKLRQARALISKPGGWTQGVVARSSDGTSVSTVDPEACAFCAMGALWAVGGLAAEVFLEEAMGRSIPSFNDAYDRTQNEIIAAFDRAITLAEMEEAT